MAELQFDLSFLDSGFYEDKEKKVLKPAIFDKEARTLGKLFAQRGIHTVSSSQLRKFFSDVRALQDKINNELRSVGIDPESTEEEGLEKHMASIKILKSKLAYAVGKRGSGTNISKSFELTISRAIDQVDKTPHSFNKGFMQFFESIVGYYYGEGGERNR